MIRDSNDDRVLYVLPARGYSGGANSVVQEAQGLLRLGWNVQIAVDEPNVRSFHRAYASLPEVLLRVRPYSNEAELATLIEDARLIVGTISTWVPRIADLIAASPNAGRKTFFYYIQDYEPLFFAHGSEHWQMAHASYTSPIPTIAFAKTDWLCRIVEANHHLKVSRVQASIDHDVFFPSLFHETDIAPISITAMMRPETKRRGPGRTARILDKLAARYSNRVKLNVFGTDKAQLNSGGYVLPDKVEVSGRLTREQVAQILRESSLFLDLSDYQAFGRTGLEAMACGCCSLLPLFGGAHEFVRHGENGYLVDVRSDEEILNAVDSFIHSSPQRRREMRRAAITTASQYSVHRAAVSISNFFESALQYARHSLSA